MLRKSFFIIVLSWLIFLSNQGASQMVIKTVVDKYGNELKVEENTITGAPHRVWNMKVDISIYGIKLSNLNKRNIEQVTRKFLADYEDIIKVKQENLILGRARKDKERWYISYKQVYQELPIYGTSVGFTITKKGIIQSLGAEVYPKVQISTTPSISLSQAVSKAKQIFKTPEMDSISQRGAKLVIYPEIADSNVIYHLVYKIKLFSLHPLKEWIYFINAKDGSVVYSYNNLKNADFNIYGYVKHGHVPEHYYDTPVVHGPTVNAWVRIYNPRTGRYEGSDYTDGNGYYSIDWSSGDVKNRVLYGEKTFSPSGSWCKIVGAKPTVHTYNFLPTADLLCSWTYVPDELNVFYHVNYIHNFIKGAPFNYSEMDYQMEATVHLNVENAYSNGINIFFGDYEWALSSDVIYHEYTHCIIYHLYDGWIDAGGDGGQDYAMDEGFADYFACTINDDPIQGESVGVGRDLDNTLRYPNDYTGEGHHDGQIIGGAAWDVRKYLTPALADELVFVALEWEPQARDFLNFFEKYTLCR